jgi:hypothetical protein
VTEVIGKRVDERFPKNAGEFSFPTAHSIRFRCPCGCGDCIGIGIKLASDPIPEGFDREDFWDWNGDKEKPTLTPSIQAVGGCQYHGYLTAGVFKSC